MYFEIGYIFIHDLKYYVISPSFSVVTQRKYFAIEVEVVRVDREFEVFT